MRDGAVASPVEAVPHRLVKPCSSSTNRVQRCAVFLGYIMQIVQAADFQHSRDELTLEILCAAEVDVRSADKQPFFPKVDFSHQPI